MKYSFMLAKEYSKNMKTPNELEGRHPPIGWFISEKFDGYRARYDNENRSFVSRAQKTFNAPEWYKDAMLSTHNLDGELWISRDNFTDMGIVRRKTPDPLDWVTIKYVVYDLPNEKAPFHKRLSILKELIVQNKIRWEKIRETLPEPYSKLDCPLIMAHQKVIKTMSQFEKVYNGITNSGGEGVMIKHPESVYEDKRSNYLLKYKPDFDAEAIIVEYKTGNNKYDGMLGSFICKPLINMGNYHIIDENENHKFSISGMDDSIRASYKATHPVGTIISYIHSGIVSSGKPRFARYTRKRDDIVIKKSEKMLKSLVKRDLVISIFSKLSYYEKSNDEKFKAASYNKAISSIKNIKDDSEITIDNLLELNGIGKSLADKIIEIFNTGTCKMYENVKDYKDPKEIFLNIHGVANVNAKKLVDLGFKTIEDLRKCPNIEDHLNEKQLIGLKFYDDILQKIPRDEIMIHEQFLKETLLAVDSSADLTIAGSYRRGKLESGDIDILLKAKTNKTYKNFIDVLTKKGYFYPKHLAVGAKKFFGLGRISNDSSYRRIDIMYTKPHEYPFAILYFTGSMEFNTEMRKKALDLGLSMNEYSLKDSNTKKVIGHTFNVERDIFSYLKLEYVDPLKR